MIKCVTAVTCRPASKVMRHSCFDPKGHFVAACSLGPCHLPRSGSGWEAGQHSQRAPGGQCPAHRQMPAWHTAPGLLPSLQPPAQHHAHVIAISTSRWPGLCKHASWRCQSLSLFWGSGHPEHLKWEWNNCLHLNGQGAGDLSRPAAVDNVVVPHKVACDAQRVVQAALHLVQHLMTTKILLNFDELITSPASPAQYSACAAVQLTT